MPNVVDQIEKSKKYLKKSIHAKTEKQSKQWLSRARKHARMARSLDPKNEGLEGLPR